MAPIVALVVVVMLSSPPALALHKGMVIMRTCSVVSREYLMPTAEGAKRAGGEEIPTFTPAITVRGNDVTVDFNGAVLRGTPASEEPDQRKGLGVLVEGDNVTLKNLHARGYKVALMAAGCKGLRILNCGFSYNWKQRLRSTPAKEDESDWQSYHHNEHDEWLRYGAAMYLKDCSKFAVERTVANGGQCGLMLVRSNSGTVVENDFSFNSGIGLGLYGSSDNKVLYNRMDWCVRGFSYGVYNRGQDSAGILVFDPCNANEFAFNSATHGGDGFFLWPGQSVMDTGKGGDERNILFGNDFSHSPCNGIEATFSSNTFVNNKLLECWHGVWGGYSFDTKIGANIFGYNGEGIAIEHGQNISITNNVFVNENTAIDLWQDPIQDKNWPYPKHHDTASRDYQIALNLFDGSTGPAISIRNTRRVSVGGNDFRRCHSSVKEEGDNSGSKLALTQIEPGEPCQKTIETNGRPVSGTSDDVDSYLMRFEVPWAPFANSVGLQRLKRPLTGAEQRVLDGGVSILPDSAGRNPFLKKGALRGQRYIIVDQWGPYDFKSPLLYPREILADSPAGVVRQRFEVLGPPGRWRAISRSGVSALSREEGAVPGFVDVYFPTGDNVSPAIELEYVGARTVDYRGVATPGGKPLAFGWRR